MTEAKVAQCLKSGIWILLCLLTISAVTFGAYFVMPASLHYHITEHYSLTATGENATVYLGTLVPKSGPYQTIEGMRVSWDSEQNREINPCIDVIKLSGTVAAGSIQEAVIDYEVSLSHGIVLWRAQADSCHLLPQCKIESDNPIIIAQASQIADGTSWWDTYKIYNYTRNLLSFSGGNANCDMEMSALEAYKSGRGECGEFSRLMVALSRASGIPSLVISGIVLPDSGPFAAATTRTWGHPGDAHAWIEFSDGDIWSMADPSWGTSTWSGLQFGSNDGRHLSYGCINHESDVYSEIRQWTEQHGSLIGKEFAALKFVATADADGVLITPIVTVKKGWDGRWSNTVLTLSITTFILCKLRNRFFFRGVTHSN